MTYNVSHFDGSPLFTSTSNHTPPGCRPVYSHVPLACLAAQMRSIASVIRGSGAVPSCSAACRK